MLHRNTLRRTQWEIPGGKIEEGETEKDAAEREAAEELGLKLRNLKEIGRANFREDGEEHSYVWFTAEIAAGNPMICEPETFDKLEYWAVDELAFEATPISANTKNLVEAIKSNAVTLS